MSAMLLEKAAQVQSLLRETQLDCWLIFARETFIHPDPGMDLVVGADVVRNSAFLFGVGGQSIAIVARFDAANVRATGVFQKVIGYDEDIRSELLSALNEINPKSIGLNYSTDDVTADGLTHGHWLLLNELLRGSPFAGMLTSAGPLLKRLRGRKSPTEVDCIRRAVAVTEEIVEKVGRSIRPGLSEQELAEQFRTEFLTRGLETAWPLDDCPIVNSGPASEPGHARPSHQIKIEPGHLVHVDLGVKIQGYCSDLQRTWYVLREGETSAPLHVQRAFSSVIQAIEASAAVLRPGAVGWQVDAAARASIVAAGYPEFKHGVGHGLGRAVHDGGTLLGPRWPCYGRLTEGIVEEGNVFTLELGVMTDAGFIGIEEDVLVTAQGCSFLSAFQNSLWLVRG